MSDQAREQAAAEAARKAAEERQNLMKAQLEKTEGVRRELMTLSAKVMDTSQPTPTQAENDAAALGLLPEGPAPVDAPSMPPIAEQQAKLAAAAAQPAPHQQRQAQPRAPAPEPHRS